MTDKREPFVKRRFLDMKNDMRNRKLAEPDKKLGYIYVEDITDKPFWEKIASKHTVTLFQNDKGSYMPGKSNLLFYKNPGETESLLDKCHKGLLIAIDSDFDELCPNALTQTWANHQNSRFVLRTYAHGRENIVFSPKCLHEILDSKFKLYINCHDNPILEVFETLSAIWFKPYRKFLFLLNNGQSQHDDWIAQIQFHNKECQEIALKKDFSQYKKRITNFSLQLNQKINNQNDFEQFCDELAEKDFTEQNVWCFIRCHDFEEKFVMPIMEMICSDRIKEEMTHIKKHYQDDKNRKVQCQNIFQKQSGIQTVLHHYFHDVYFSQAKETDVFLRKIVADYAKIVQAA